MQFLRTRYAYLLSRIYETARICQVANVSVAYIVGKNVSLRQTQICVTPVWLHENVCPVFRSRYGRHYYSNDRPLCFAALIFFSAQFRRSSADSQQTFLHFRKCNLGNYIRNFGPSAIPRKIWDPKTRKFGPDLGQLSDLTVYNFGIEQSIVSSTQKVA